MHEASPIISKAVATMIENAPSLFTIPRELGDDVANFWREMEDPNIAAFDETVEKENLNDQANIQKTKVYLWTISILGFSLDHYQHLSHPSALSVANKLYCYSTVH